MDQYEDDARGAVHISRDNYQPLVDVPDISPADTVDADENFLPLQEALRPEPAWQDVVLNYPASVLVALGVGCGLLLMVLGVMCCVCCHYSRLKKREEDKLLQATARLDRTGKQVETNRNAKDFCHTTAPYREPEEYTDTEGTDLSSLSPLLTDSKGFSDTPLTDDGPFYSQASTQSEDNSIRRSEHCELYDQKEDQVDHGYLEEKKSHPWHQPAYQRETTAAAKPQIDTEPFHSARFTSYPDYNKSEKDLEHTDQYHSKNGLHRPINYSKSDFPSTTFPKLGQSPVTESLESPSFPGRNDLFDEFQGCSMSRKIRSAQEFMTTHRGPNTLFQRYSDPQTHAKTLKTKGDYPSTSNRLVSRTRFPDSLNIPSNDLEKQLATEQSQSHAAAAAHTSAHFDEAFKSVATSGHKTGFDEPKTQNQMYCDVHPNNMQNAERVETKGFPSSQHDNIPVMSELSGALTPSEGEKEQHYHQQSQQSSHHMTQDSTMSPSEPHQSLYQQRLFTTYKLQTCHSPESSLQSQFVTKVPSVSNVPTLSQKQTITSLSKPGPSVSKFPSQPDSEEFPKHCIQCTHDFRCPDVQNFPVEGYGEKRMQDTSLSDRISSAVESHVDMETVHTGSENQQKLRDPQSHRRMQGKCLDASLNVHSSVQQLKPNQTVFSQHSRRGQHKQGQFQPYSVTKQDAEMSSASADSGPNLTKPNPSAARLHAHRMVTSQDRIGSCSAFVPTMMTPVKKESTREGSKVSAQNRKDASLDTKSVFVSYSSANTGHRNGKPCASSPMQMTDGPADNSVAAAALVMENEQACATGYPIPNKKLDTIPYTLSQNVGNQFQDLQASVVQHEQQNHHYERSVPRSAPHFADSGSSISKTAKTQTISSIPGDPKLSNNEHALPHQIRHSRPQVSVASSATIHLHPHTAVARNNFDMKQIQQRSRALQTEPQISTRVHKQGELYHSHFHQGQCLQNRICPHQASVTSQLNSSDLSQPVASLTSMTNLNFRTFKDASTQGPFMFQQDSSFPNVQQNPPKFHRLSHSVDARGNVQINSVPSYEVSMSGLEQFPVSPDSITRESSNFKANISGSSPEVSELIADSQYNPCQMKQLRTSTCNSENLQQKIVGFECRGGYSRLQGEHDVSLISKPTSVSHGHICCPPFESKKNRTVYAIPGTSDVVTNTCPETLPGDSFSALTYMPSGSLSTRTLTRSLTGFKQPQQTPETSTRLSRERTFPETHNQAQHEEASLRTEGYPVHDRHHRSAPETSARTPQSLQTCTKSLSHSIMIEKGRKERTIKDIERETLGRSKTEHQRETLEAKKSAFQKSPPALSVKCIDHNNHPTKSETCFNQMTKTGSDSAYQTGISMIKPTEEFGIYNETNRLMSTRSADIPNVRQDALETYHSDCSCPHLHFTHPQRTIGNSDIVIEAGMVNDSEYRRSSELKMKADVVNYSEQNQPLPTRGSSYKFVDAGVVGNSEHTQPSQLARNSDRLVKAPSMDNSEQSRPSRTSGSSAKFVEADVVGDSEKVCPVLSKRSPGKMIQTDTDNESKEIDLLRRKTRSDKFANSGRPNSSSDRIYKTKSVQDSAQSHVLDRRTDNIRHVKEFSDVTKRNGTADIKQSTDRIFQFVPKTGRTCQDRQEMAHEGVLTAMQMEKDEPKHKVEAAKSSVLSTTKNQQRCIDPAKTHGEEAVCTINQRRNLRTDSKDTTVSYVDPDSDGRKPCKTKSRKQKEFSGSDEPVRHYYPLRPSQDVVSASSSQEQVAGMSPPRSPYFHINEARAKKAMKKYGQRTMAYSKLPFPKYPYCLHSPRHQEHKILKNKNFRHGQSEHYDEMTSDSTEWEIEKPPQRKVSKLRRTFDSQSQKPSTPYSPYCWHRSSILNEIQNLQHTPVLSNTNAEWESGHPSQRTVPSWQHTFSHLEKKSHKLPVPEYPFSIPSPPFNSSRVKNTCLVADTRHADADWDYIHPPERKVSGIRRKFSNESKNYKRNLVPEYPYYPGHFPSFSVRDGRCKTNQHFKHSMSDQESFPQTVADTCQTDADWDYIHPPERKVSGIRRKFSNESKNYKRNLVPEYPYYPGHFPSFSVRDGRCKTNQHFKHSMSDQESFPQTVADTCQTDADWDYIHPPERKVSGIRRKFSNESKNYKRNLVPEYPYYPGHFPSFSVRDGRCKTNQHFKHSMSDQESFPQTVADTCQTDADWDYIHPPERKVSGVRRTFSNESKNYKKLLVPEYPYYPGHFPSFSVRDGRCKTNQHFKHSTSEQESSPKTYIFESEDPYTRGRQQQETFPEYSHASIFYSHFPFQKSRSVDCIHDDSHEDVLERSGPSLCKNVNSHTADSPKQFPDYHHRSPSSPTSPPKKKRYKITEPYVKDYQKSHGKVSALQRSYSSQSKKMRKLPFAEWPHYPCSSSSSSPKTKLDHAGTARTPSTHTLCQSSAVKRHVCQTTGRKNLTSPRFVQAVSMKHCYPSSLSIHSSSSVRQIPPNQTKHHYHYCIPKHESTKTKEVHHKKYAKGTDGTLCISEKKERNHTELNERRVVESENHSSHRKETKRTVRTQLPNYSSSSFIFPKENGNESHVKIHQSFSGLQEKLRGKVSELRTHSSQSHKMRKLLSPKWPHYPRSSSASPNVERNTAHTSSVSESGKMEVATLRRQYSHQSKACPTDLSSPSPATSSRLKEPIGVRSESSVSDFQADNTCNAQGTGMVAKLRRVFSDHTINHRKSWALENAQHFSPQRTPFLHIDTGFDSQNHVISDRSKRKDDVHRTAIKQDIHQVPNRSPRLTEIENMQHHCQCSPSMHTRSPIKQISPVKSSALYHYSYCSPAQKVCGSPAHAIGYKDLNKRKVLRLPKHFNTQRKRGKSFLSRYSHRSASSETSFPTEGSYEFHNKFKIEQSYSSNNQKSHGNVYTLRRSYSSQSDKMSRLPCPERSRHSCSLSPSLPKSKLDHLDTIQVTSVPGCEDVLEGRVSALHRTFSNQAKPDVKSLPYPMYPYYPYPGVASPGRKKPDKMRSESIVSDLQEDESGETQSKGKVARLRRVFSDRDRSNRKWWFSANTQHSGPQSARLQDTLNAPQNGKQQSENISCQSRPSTVKAKGSIFHFPVPFHTSQNSYERNCQRARHNCFCRDEQDQGSKMRYGVQPKLKERSPLSTSVTTHEHHYRSNPKKRTYPQRYSVRDNLKRLEWLHLAENVDKDSYVRVGPPKVPRAFLNEERARKAMKRYGRSRMSYKKLPLPKYHYYPVLPVLSPFQSKSSEKIHDCSMQTSETDYKDHSDRKINKLRRLFSNTRQSDHNTQTSNLLSKSSAKNAKCTRLRGPDTRKRLVSSLCREFTQRGVRLSGRLAPVRTESSHLSFNKL